MKIWAHRGCCAAFPENTLPAFAEACSYQIEGIELDIQLSKDGGLVVIHDELVDRTTDSAGYVKDYTVQDLKKMKIYAGSEDGQAVYTNIPTMREVYELLKPYCRQYGILINIELKNSKVRYEGMEDKILELTDEMGMKPYVIYSSFLAESMGLIKKLDSSAVTGILAVKASQCMAEAEKYGADALHPGITGMDVEAGRLKKAGMPVRVWNTAEPFFPEKKQTQRFDLDSLEEAGATDLFTNFPEWYAGKR